MFGGIPFEHFAQHGGGGGGMPSRRSREPADTTQLYKTLGVEKSVSTKDLRRAYLKLSKTHHPDKGGDADMFKKINAAYEILSDPEKREKYDKYGVEGVSEDGGGGGGGGEDLFSMFFGGQRGGRGGRSGPRKGPDTQHPIKVSLEDLYNGKTVKLAINRRVIVGEPLVCNSCKGQGMKVEIRQLGPGMITQVQRPCGECQGQGTSAKTKQERKLLEVHIEKGMSHNEKVTFRNMADETPNMEAGDIHFVVQAKEHSLFKRKGADLLVTKDVGLNQALTGFQWKITHLDGREIVIKTKPGQIIQCETTDEETGRTLPFITVVKDEGMPSRGNPFVRGNLYIAFHVKFPTSLTADVVSTLKKILPGGVIDEEYDLEMVEEHFMEPADLRAFGKGGAAMGGNEYDSDEEGGAQPVQCQQS